MLHTSVSFTQLSWFSFSKIAFQGKSLSNCLPTFKFLIINTELFLLVPPPTLPKKIRYLVCNKDFHSSPSFFFFFSLNGFYYLISHFFSPVAVEFLFKSNGLGFIHALVSDKVDFLIFILLDALMNARDSPFHIFSFLKVIQSRTGRNRSGAAH